MGWAAGFNAGRQLGRELVDTYNQSAAEQEFNRIRDEKPEVSQGFTADQGDQLRAAAASGQYDIGFQDGQYTVTPKADPSQVGRIGPGEVTDFFGERRAGALNPRQVEYARQAQMAGAVSRRNPLAGARMMRELDQNERDQVRFDQGTEAHGLNMRESRLRVGQQEESVGYANALGKYMQEAVQNPNAVEQDRLGINDNHSRFTITKDPKGGYSFIDVQPGGADKTIPLNFMQVAEARALIKAMAEYPGQAPAALNRLSAINKDLAEAVARENNMKLEAFKATDTSQHHRTMGNAATITANAAAARAAHDSRMGRMGQSVQWTDDKGNVKVSVPVLGTDGKMTWQTSDAPAGFRLQKQMDPKVIEERAAQLVGLPDPDNQTKKMTPYRAYEVARQQVYGGDGGSNLPPIPAAPPARPGAGTRAAPPPAPPARAINPRAAEQTPITPDSVLYRGLPVPPREDGPFFDPYSQPY
jgi:hypothetical protein